MNKNHYDPVKIYSSKISRIKTILQRIEEAEHFIGSLPDQSKLQKRWMQVIWSRWPDANKSKSINKGYLKNSIRKTLANIRIQQQKAMAQIEQKLEEFDPQAQINEENVMIRLKAFVQSLKSN